MVFMIHSFPAMVQAKCSARTGFYQIFLIIIMLSSIKDVQSLSHVPNNIISLNNHKASFCDKMLTRRLLLHAVGATASGILLLPLQKANAAAPIAREETDNSFAQVLRYIRPKPVKILRNKLNQDFAVLLMRASYNVLDELDCVPMDQFQRDFFLIRQAEYETYVNALGPGIVQQGFLSDPYYFDFISYAQYRTINREITNDPPMMFTEQQPITNNNNDADNDDQPQQFAGVLIRRDPALRNEQLAAEHNRRVGAAIIDRFQELYSNTPIALPKYSSGESGRPSNEQILSILSQLVKLFMINGFAWDGSATMNTADGKSKTVDVCLTLVSPATSWGGHVLEWERSSITNDFLLKAATTALQRAGCRVVKSSVKYDGTNQMSYITIE